MNFHCLFSCEITHMNPNMRNQPLGKKKKKEKKKKKNQAAKRNKAQLFSPASPPVRRFLSALLSKCHAPALSTPRSSD